MDGTKVKANATRHKAMSYGHMVKAEAEAEAELKAQMTAMERMPRCPLVAGRPSSTARLERVLQTVCCPSKLAAEWRRSPKADLGPFFF